MLVSLLGRLSPDGALGGVGADLVLRLQRASPLGTGTVVGLHRMAVCGQAGLAPL